METTGRGRKRPQPTTCTSACGMEIEQPAEASGQTKKRTKGKPPAEKDAQQSGEFVSTRDIKDMWKEMGYSVKLEILRHFEMVKRFEMSRVSKEWSIILSNSGILSKQFLFVEDDPKSSKAIQTYRIKDRETKLFLVIVGNGRSYGGDDSTDDKAIKNFLMKNPQVHRVIYYKAVLQEEQIVNDRGPGSYFDITGRGEDFWYLLDSVTLVKCKLKIQFETRIPSTPDHRLWTWRIDLPRLTFAFKDKNKPADMFLRWGLYFKEMSKQKVFWPYPPEQMEWLKKFLPKVRGAAKKHTELFFQTRHRSQYIRVKNMPGSTDMKLWGNQLFERECGILMFELMMSGMKGLERTPHPVPASLADFDYM